MTTYDLTSSPSTQAKNLLCDLIPSPLAVSEYPAGEVTPPKQVLVCDYLLGFFDGTQVNLSFSSNSSTSDTAFLNLAAECKAQARAYADSLKVNYLLTFLGYRYGNYHQPEPSFHAYQED